MKEVLLSALEKKQIVSLYTNMEDMSRFTAGFVLAVSDEHVLLNSVGTTGADDGLYLLSLDLIYRIDLGGAYENKLYKLRARLKQSVRSFVSEQDMNLLESFCQYAYNNSFAVSFLLFDDDNYSVSGFINSIKDNAIGIKCLSDYGKPNGITFIKRESIMKATCDSEFERIIKYLSETSCEAD